MSHQVGNPEDRFSCVAAQMSHLYNKKLPIQYTEIFFFLMQKLKISLKKKNDIFCNFVQNINCGYPQSTVEYPQSVFWIKNKKNFH